MQHLQENFPYIVLSVSSIGNTLGGRSIPVVEIGLPGKTSPNKDMFYFRNNRAKLTSQEVQVIRQRQATVVVGYVGGDEGASMFSCLYSMYYLILGAVNQKPDILKLLKTTRFTFVCALNLDRLDDLENWFIHESQGAIATRIKNKRNTGTCSSDQIGVNLKLNFRADDTSNSCSSNYRGTSVKSEPEIASLMTYLDSMQTSPTLGQVITFGK
mgnify:FL=1